MVHDVFPECDVTGAMKGMLAYFRNSRIMYKNLAKEWESKDKKTSLKFDRKQLPIKILSYKEDVIMDPFNGSGTTCLAAEMLGRSWIGVDISPNYCEVARKRVREYQLQQNQLEIQMETPIK